MRPIILVLSLYTFFSQLLVAQQVSDYQVGLALKIDDSDKRKLEKAVEDVVEGLQEADVAHNMYNELSEKEKNQWKSSGHKKVLKTMADASSLVQKGHMEIYEIYNDYCEKFWEVTREEGYYAAGMNKAKYYERKAKNQLNSAIRDREFVESSDNYQRALSKFQQALDLEKLAIRDKGRALQIYQDFPVEYDYGWEDDVDAETVARFFADKYVVEPEDDEPKTKVDTVFIKETDTVYMAAQKNIVPDTSAVADTTELEWLPDVVFKVQIAAHIKPISDAEVRAIYNGKERVNVVFEDNWYKYQMGPYDKYTEAKQVLNATPVKNAFIVPYLDGKKLTIEEAVKTDAD